MDEGVINQSVTSRELLQYINIEKAKFIACAIVFAALVYHSSIKLTYGTDSCHLLLSDGRFQGYDVWQPYGCMIHRYTHSDAQMCMRYTSYWGGRNHIAFIGDSHIRQLFLGFVRCLNSSGSNSRDDVGGYRAHKDVHFHDRHTNARVDFFWRPMVNSSMYDLYYTWHKQVPPGARPNFIIMGSATWTIRTFNGSRQALDNFRANLSTIVPHIHTLYPATRVIWMLQDQVDEDKMSADRSMITNAQIDDYNKAAIELLESSEVTVWRSSRLVADGFQKESMDGLHISGSALSLKVQILLNFFCNNDMNHSDGTCCNSMEPAGTLQIIVAAFFLVCAVLFVTSLFYRWRAVRRLAIRKMADVGAESVGRPSAGVFNKLFTILFALFRLGTIMGYFYLCDRTNFFMKENKHFTHVNFLLPFVYVMVLGMFFTESTHKNFVMSEDQMSEWKGCLLLIILVYHVTGGDQVMPVYMLFRLAVSSYLFLAGFEHFTYFWLNADYSLFHIATVLVKLNLMTVTLCVVMDRPYQFYHITPLLTFWFLVIYVFMATCPRVCQQSAYAKPQHYVYIIVKFAVLLAVISLFYLSEVFFDEVFMSRLLRPFFVSADDSANQWRFRWQTDRLSPVYGMVFSIVYHTVVKMGLLEDNHRHHLFSKLTTTAVCLLALVGMAGYICFAFLCGHESQCISVHSYGVIIPILSFLILRNIPGFVRTRHSSLFVWFGGIWLELFLCQYHVWLAADTHGILVLLPSYPILNVIVTTFIMVCVAHDLFSITHILVECLVLNDDRKLVRCVCLVMSLVVIVSLTQLLPLL